MLGRARSVIQSRSIAHVKWTLVLTWAYEEAEFELKNKTILKIFRHTYFSYGQLSHWVFQWKYCSLLHLCESKFWETWEIPGGGEGGCLSGRNKICTEQTCFKSVANADETSDTRQPPFVTESAIGAVTDGFAVGPLSSRIFSAFTRSKRISSSRSSMRW